MEETEGHSMARVRHKAKYVQVMFNMLLLAYLTDHGPVDFIRTTR